MIGTVNDIVCLSGEAVVHIPLINLVLLTNKTIEVFTEGGISEEVIPFLRHLGLDTSREIAVSVAQYRNFTSNVPSIQVAIVGLERQDNEWVWSGRSSLQAMIGRNRDPWLRNDLYRSACLDMVQVEGITSLDKSSKQFVEAYNSGYIDTPSTEKERTETILSLKQLIKTVYNIYCMV